LGCYCDASNISADAVFNEGSLTALPVEIKCALFLGFWSLLTIPIARDPSMAWEKFSEEYIKVIVIFVVMINTLRTKSRLKGIMWLGVAAGLLLSYEAVKLYRAGIFQTEDYRVSVEFGGMFGNPNDLALHLVIFTPIAVALGIASKNKFFKLVFHFRRIYGYGKYRNPIARRILGAARRCHCSGLEIWKKAAFQNRFDFFNRRADGDGFCSGKFWFANFVNFYSGA
jgi:hypothetical protein